MAKVEERINLLAQQVTTMTADVTALQSELAVSGAQVAELMVRLVTNDPRIKRIVEATDETATLGLESASFGGEEHTCNDKQSHEIQVQGGERLQEKTRESFTAFKMEVQNWVGALRVHMLRVMELAETKEREADVRSAGMSKEKDRRLYQLLVACTRGEAKNYVCNTERSGFKARKQIVFRGLSHMRS